jgi:hypothetical protein
VSGVAQWQSPAIAALHEHAGITAGALSIVEAVLRDVPPWDERCLTA